jgi:hypothetical protein
MERVRITDFDADNEDDGGPQHTTHLCRCFSCGALFLASVKKPFPLDIGFCVCCGQPAAPAE